MYDHDGGYLIIPGSEIPTGMSVNLAAAPAPSNHSPVIQNGNITHDGLELQETVSGQLVLTDQDGDSLSLHVNDNLISGPTTLNLTAGVLVINPNGSYQYTVNSSALEGDQDIVDLRLTDSKGDYTSGLLTFKVFPAWNIQVTPNYAPLGSGNYNWSTTVQVNRQDGSPVQGSLIFLDSDSVNVSAGYTDSNGTVTMLGLSLLSAGTHELSAHSTQVSKGIGNTQITVETPSAYFIVSEPPAPTPEPPAPTPEPPAPTPEPPAPTPTPTGTLKVYTLPQTAWWAQPYMTTITPQVIINGTVYYPITMYGDPLYDESYNLTGYSYTSQILAAAIINANLTNIAGVVDVTIDSHTDPVDITLPLDIILSLIHI